MRDLNLEHQLDETLEAGPDVRRAPALPARGAALTLTPAYDICPQPRSGREVNQAMLIEGGDRRSRLETCLLAAPGFLLSDKDARAIFDAQVSGLRSAWDRVCDEAELSAVDCAYLRRRQFMNDYALEGYVGRA